MPLRARFPSASPWPPRHGGVFFRFFLHIDLRRNSRPDLQLLLFSAMIVAPTVCGTLWCCSTGMGG